MGSAVNSPLDSYALEQASGSFFYRQLSDRALVPLANKLRAGSDPSLEEISTLFSTPLTLLAKLATLRVGGPTVGKIRPVYFIPLAELIEREGSAHAVEQLRGELRELQLPRPFGAKLFVAIDRWSGDFSFSELLSSLHRLLEGSGSPLSLLPIGPSTAELTAAAKHYQRSESTLPLHSLLTDLRSFGISAVDGGTSLEVHAHAARAGFHLCLGQDISTLFEAKSLAGMGVEINDPTVAQLVEERFAAELLEIRHHPLVAARLLVWFPWCRLELPLPPLERPSAVPLLRVIALARLLLPSVPLIRAPLSLFGRHLAQVALACGANDLGFVAVDSRTARKLALFRMSELRDVLAPLSVRSSEQP